MRPATNASRRATPATGGGHRGITLVELLVSLAVMAIVAAMAYPSFRQWLAWQRVNLAADLLAGALESARTIAAARHGTVVLAPLPGAGSLAPGWRLLSAEDGEPSAADGRVLSVVQLRSSCLRIDMRATAGAGHTLRVTGVGYSRPERGGFLAATFTVRCDDAQRQVRLGAQGRLRICTPGRDADCDGADAPDP